MVPGQPVTYTLTISNTGSVAHDLVLTDTVPDDIIPLSGGVTASIGDTVDGTGGAGMWSAGRKIVWTIPLVAAGTDVVLTYDTDINSPLTGGSSLQNSVTVTGTSLAGANADERTTYSASTTKTVEGPVISTISKQADVTDVTVGDLVTYTVKINVPGGVIAYDVTMVDQLPAGMAFEAFTAVACEEFGPVACTPARSATSLNSAGDSGTLGFFVGDINPGSVEPQILTFVYTARVLDDAVTVVDSAGLDNSAGTYSNATDKILGTPATTPDPTTYDATPVDALIAAVDVIEPKLTIDKDVAGQVADTDVRRAKPGDTLTFTVAVTNDGTAPAHDVVITDTPDSRLTGYAFTPVAGVTNTDGDPSDGTLQWTVPGPIPVNGSVTLTYTLTVPNTLDETAEVAGFEVTNTADISTYFGAPLATRNANMTVAYRAYGAGAYDVASDTVNVELDLASIGDRVWYDLNGNGIQEPGEPGLNGVDVTVTYLNGPGTADDESVTVTTANVLGVDGVWLVNKLPGGSYTVDVDATDVPPGLTPSYDHDDLLVTPDGDWAGTIGEGEAKRDVDAGFDGTRSIGNLVWFDQDLSGSQNGNEGGVPGIDVTLVWGGPDGNLATTADNVTYTDITDVNGAYLFDDLPDGPYSVTLDATDLPAGMKFVKDPDAGAANGTALVTLAGSDNLAQDFGVAGAGQIGDTIYLDRNGDGSQAATGEPGLEGVTVTLTYAGPDGMIGGPGAVDDETYTDVTDADGRYLFANLPASNYTIRVSGPLPSGATNSADPDNAVGAGDNTSAVTLGDGTILGDNIDTDQDFGYDVDSEIGDRVWWDT
ncbi:MAG: hypothetical protein OEW42_19810, partial [Acidimicrobiia bacterium]|nr:hypothetical protein [Acidimicrobiia bacterium]